MLERNENENGVTKFRRATHFVQDKELHSRLDFTTLKAPGQKKKKQVASFAFRRKGLFCEKNFRF